MATVKWQPDSFYLENRTTLNVFGLSLLVQNMSCVSSFSTPDPENWSIYMKYLYFSICDHQMIHYKWSPVLSMILLHWQSVPVTGFPTWAGNWAGRGGSDPITRHIKAQKWLPAQLPALEKKFYQPNYHPYQP